MPATETTNPTPTVIVYQNADFVSGLLQEIYKAGILEAAELGDTSKAGESDGSNKKIGGSGKGSGGLFGIGHAEVGTQGEFVKQQLKNDESVATHNKKYVYSQAFYLDQVRSALRKKNLIRSISDSTHLEDISVGEFVEFQASFTANEANAILDILTPQLIAAIVRYLRRTEGLKEIEDLYTQADNAGVEVSVDKISANRAIHEAKANDQSELTAAIAGAIRMDFRSDTTKEFYARVGVDPDAFTAITVCESEYFMSKDFDRLLDGQFTVLAKVISPKREDTPVLEKNKLLSRLNIDALEKILRPLAEESELEGVANLAFNASVEGPSITVLPIAVYV